MLPLRPGTPLLPGIPKGPVGPGGPIIPISPLAPFKNIDKYLLPFLDLGKIKDKFKDVNWKTIETWREGTKFHPFPTIVTLVTTTAYIIVVVSL